VLFYIWRPHGDAILSPLVLSGQQLSSENASEAALILLPTRGAPQNLDCEMIVSGSTRTKADL